MQKVINGRLIFILVITIACLWLTYPTARYFLFVSGLPEEPTPEQVQQRNDMLEARGIINLGLDLQGGADFLIAVDTDSLIEQKLINDMEALRAEFIAEDVDASLRLIGENPREMEVAIRLNNADLDRDIAADIVTDLLDGEIVETINLAFEGDVRAALQDGEMDLRADISGINQSEREAMEAALKVIRRRVDEFGLTQPIVQRADSNRIRVQVPGETNPERLRESLLRTAALEFRLLHPDHDTQIADFIVGGAQGILPDVGTGVIKPEFLKEVENPEKPGTTRLVLREDITGIPSGYVLRLGRKVAVDPQTGTQIEEESIDNLAYMVRREVPLGGDNLRRAAVFVNPQALEDPIAVTIEFDAQGARIFRDITTENVGRRFAIILDDTVFSAPNIREPITGGTAQITGGFSQAEARDLSLTLRAGALPADLVVVEENTIGPFLGADSIVGAGKALVIGALLIITLMVFVYRTCGVISVLAMLLNVLLIMAILSMMGATLTLSGIGGILLTMGMAVDANILIYERLREELDQGKPVRAAINMAFGRAFQVILDSNITSLLPALVLVLFEVVDGSVKGFWVALSIGLIANLYTGMVVTRALIESWYAKTRTLDAGTFRFIGGDYMGKKSLFGRVSVDWMKYRKVGVSVYLAVALIAGSYVAVQGPNFGIDFTGGVLSTVRIQGEENLSVGGISREFDGFRDVRVIKVVNREGQWQITVPQLPGADGVTPTLDEIRGRVAQNLSDAYGAENVDILSSQSVDPQVGNEFKTVAIFSVIITCAVILTFLAFRFQWIFGAGAVAALLTDVFLSLGLFKLLGRSVSLDIVSALLIILGYSVNDTIVVFDRIREKMQERLTGNLREIINTGINETLNRTVLTSGTTFLAVFTMWLFGGSGLSDFALILLLGIISGTASSIFIASSLVYTYLERKGLTTVIQARKATAKVAVPRTRKDKATQKNA